MTARLPVEVVIPLRWKEQPPADPRTQRDDNDPLPELAAHLERLVREADVTVVDGSDEAAIRRHRAAFDPNVRVITPRGQGLNGKVLGAVTGVYPSRHELVVLADDDVRHDRSSLDQLMFALQDADIVQLQNVFTAWPWHARWDNGRSLLARSVGADWPGTFGLRASAIQAMGGWDADVLFENLEMVRTAQAAGLRVARRPDIVVGRSHRRAVSFGGSGRVRRTTTGRNRAGSPPNWPSCQHFSSSPDEVAPPCSSPWAVRRGRRRGPGSLPRAADAVGRPALVRRLAHRTSSARVARAVYPSLRRGVVPRPPACACRA